MLVLHITECTRNLVRFSIGLTSTMQSEGTQQTGTSSTSQLPNACHWFNVAIFMGKYPGKLALRTGGNYP